MPSRQSHHNVGCVFACVSEYIGTMEEDFGVPEEEVPSSGELWSHICSTLPGVKEEQVTRENTSRFTDSFQPSTGQSVNVQSTNGTSNTNWKPMDDSEVYIASLGLYFVPN